MKIVLWLALIYFFVAPVFGMGFMPKWWDNPHSFLLGLNQSKLFSNESSKKPKLTGIKENLYMPFEAVLYGVEYRGLITVKPDGSGLPKIGGAVFRDNQTEALSLLEGIIVDKESFYEINFKVKNASQIFKSQTKYQTVTEFPTHLEIRGFGKKNSPYLVGPVNAGKNQRVKFLPTQIDVEKNYIGKWFASSFEGSWDFEFGPLPGSQLTGSAYYSFPGKKCAYPMFAFPLGRNELLFMTGESTVNPTECETRSWISYSEQGPIVEFHPYSGDGLKLFLKKQ